MAESEHHVNLTTEALAEAKRLGHFIKADHPAARGIFKPQPRTETSNGLHIEYDARILTRDGVALYGNIYRPANSLDSKLPVLFNYCVYGKDGGIELTFFPPSCRLDPARTGAEYLFEGTDPVWWCDRGYAVAVVDARGSFLSEGDKYYYGRSPGLDGYDIVEWLASQEWSNGKVGMYGASAYAMLMWSVAAEQPPHLAAILPYDGMTDLYREMAHKGGIPETQFTHVYPTLFNWGPGLVEDSVAAQSNHPYFDEYWKSKVPALEKITCPAYVVSSWGDHCIHTRGTLNGYYGIKSKDKWLELHQYQKWDFAVQPESLQRQKAFFDHFLAGQRTEVEFWPKVRYAVREAFYVGQWRESDTFPLPETQYTEFFPTPLNSLSLIQQPSEHKVSYDASVGEVTFELPMQSSLEFVGHSRLRLWVEAEGADNLDLFVTLRKLDKHGKPIHFPWLTIIDNGPVAFGFLRASRRELDTAQTKPWRPYHSHARDLPPLKPGEIVPVDIEIQPTSCKVLPGESLVVCISGHDYEKYPDNIPVARHTNTVNKGKHIIHFGGKYDSGLLLPVQPAIEHSWKDSKKPVKMFLSGTDPSFANFAPVVNGIAAHLPFLQTCTGVVMPSTTTEPTPSSQGVRSISVLGWSSYAALGAIRNPNFAAGVKKFLTPGDANQVGSIATTMMTLSLEPQAFQGRKDATLVVVFLPKAADATMQNVTADLAERGRTVGNAGAGTALLQYVLSIDTTPPVHAKIFGGTVFESVKWGSLAGVEQFWFSDNNAATDFFRDGSGAAILQTFPSSVDGSNVVTLIGSEHKMLEKSQALEKD